MESKDISQSGLGQRVRQERVRRGLSQGDLGKRVGWQQNTVSSLETGITKYVERERLMAIADCLRLPKPELLETAGFPVTAAERQEAENYNAASILFADVWWDADEATRHSLMAQLRGLSLYHKREPDH